MHQFLAITDLIAGIVAPIAASLAQQTDHPLPDDAVRAANICMAASHPNMRDGKIQLRDSIEAAWYLLEGIRENPQPGSLADRLSAFPSPNAADTQVSPAEAPYLVNQCRQRWHNSHRGAIQITLPVRRYDRDAQCYSVISFVNGMVGNNRVGDEEELSWRVKKKMSYYNNRFTGRLFAEHGLGAPDKQGEFFSRLTLRVLDLGNMNDVVDACLKTAG